MIIKTAINRSIINVIIDTNLCNLNPFIKQCYRIAWSVEKIQKAKTQKLTKNQENQCFYQNLQCEGKNGRFIKEQKAILDDTGLVGEPTNF